MELTVDMHAIWEQTKGLARSPAKFFAKSKKEKSWKKALPFVIVTAAVGHVFTAIYGIVFSPSIAGEIANNFEGAEVSYKPVEVIPAVIISFLITIVMSFVWGGAMKLWLSLFKVHSSFSQAYRVTSYSRAPNYLLSWVPFLNFFVGIYSFYLLWIALITEYSVSKKKALIIIFTSFLALAAISLVLVSLVFVNLNT
jgi:hypothetical protein